MPRMTICRSNPTRALTALAVLTLGLAPVVWSQARPQTHTVEKGDTLWDLARKYLGDPFLWPQIYRLNTDVVEDPHWIYPGELLRLDVGAETRAVPAEETPAPVAPAAAPDTTAPAPAPELPAAAPEEEVDSPGMALFRRRGTSDASDAMRSYRDYRFRPLRPGEFHSAGFLTEEQVLPLGSLIGPVTPEQIETARAAYAVQQFRTVAVVPPAGATYAAGDSLLLVELREGPEGYGEMVVPTGLARVTGMNGDQVLATVLAIYGPIRSGQLVLPAERFADPGPVQPQPVQDGPAALVLAGKETRELRVPQQIMFIGIGRQEGVALGDIFEARRSPGPQPKAEADAVDELMATLRVVHVRDRSATVQIVSLVSPDIPVGTRVKQVSRLPR